MEVNKEDRVKESIAINRLIYLFHKMTATLICFLEPLSIAWRDGRTFRVTQVIEVGEFRPGFEGFFTAKYRVSIGNRRTNLYLEQHLNRPESGMPPTVRWWVHEFV